MLDLPTPALIGVIHLPALPGSPGHLLPIDEIIVRAVEDARVLQDASFDAAIVENLGDVPLSADQLPPASVAALSVVADRVRETTSLRIGINALRNDALSALGIAVACGASFIRVNVHCGVAATDQGLIEGRADETLRYRKLLGRPIAILADVHVKHASSLNEPDIARAAADTAYRGLADGLILTGPATGEPVDMENVRRVKEAVPDRRLFVGSGATVETVEPLLAMTGGVIVGTGIKADRKVGSPIDADLARAFAGAAGRG